MKQLKSLLQSLFVWEVLICIAASAPCQWNPDYSVGTVTGNFNFYYNQTPDQLVEIYPPLYTAGATLTYQWEQSASPDFAESTVVGTQSIYTFSGPLSRSMYYRRKATDGSGNTIYSNTINIEVVSVNWENLNYIRVHDLFTPGVTDWKTVDQLPIGDKLQTTTYFDGLGRPLEKV